MLSFAKIKMAITVDDLPEHGAIPTGMDRFKITKKMLEGFKKENVIEAYGFINAGKVADFNGLNESLKLWIDYGHPLANHTYNHKSLNKVSIDEFKNQIALNEKPLSELSPNQNWKLFRYPYLHEGNELEKRNAIREYLIERGYQIAQVTVDFEDWIWNEPYARCVDRKDSRQIKWLKASFIENAKDHLRRAERISRALFKRPIPHILLLHVGAFDAEMIEDLIKMYKSEGVEFIKLAEALKDPVYAIDPKIVAKSGSELTFQIMKSKGLTLKDVGLQPYKGFPEKKLNSICR